MTHPGRFVTAGTPGIGGRIKDRPEDFLVEEVPLYEPSGEGEHLYLWVQKRGMTTLEAARMLARHYRRPFHAVGYAGLKDKHAVTWQMFSVHLPGADDGTPPEPSDRFRVLWAQRHGNKLRRGHLAGNRFVIRVRGVDPTAAVRAWEVLRVLRAQGVPNRVGAQRFGIRGNNERIALALVRGDAPGVLRELLGASPDRPDVLPEAYARSSAGEYEAALSAFPRSARAERAVLAALARGRPPERAIGAIDPAERAFFVSALQSAIFNRILEQRISAGTLGTLLPGDVAVIHGCRATFAVDQRTAEDPETVRRLGDLEISPSGPMWGPRMERAGGAVGRAEREALERAGLGENDLPALERIGGEAGSGARRPLRVPLLDPDVEGGFDEHGPFVRVAFQLPRGAFATTVMEEIIKPEGGSL